MLNRNLKLRADFYTAIRAFFAERGVLEVETPLLCSHTVTDPHIESFQTTFPKRYLQTSPEYAMKRLLARGSGSIFQICKAFRQGESGHRHNPEFTMLEWYRPGFTHYDLIHEIDLFFQTVLHTKSADIITYRQLFLHHLNIDPFTENLEILKQCIKQQKIEIDLTNIDYDTALQILLTHRIESHLGFEKPIFIVDFPPSQAALSKIEQDVAHRFEAYIQGIEVANGFHELTDPKEQIKRFKADQIKRKSGYQHIPEIDMRLIDALKQGMPDCAGVAIGIDRLLMYLSHAHHIRDVISFAWNDV